MKLVKQDESGLNENIRKYGCRYRCLQAIAEITEGRTLSKYDIETVYDKFVKKGDKDIMNETCYCGKKDHIITENAFYRLRLDEKKKVKQVGGRDSSGESWGVAGDFIIKHFKTPYGGHFILFDKDDNEIFDPSEAKIERLSWIKDIYYKVY